MLPLPRGAVWQLLFLFCAALYINGVRADGRVVCYYTNWSVYRPGTAKFNPQNINPYLCTHLIYAFGGFTKDNQMKPFDKYQDIEQGGYAKFTGLKTYNKQLKTMIAIGGWNEASSRFSPLVANAERRQKFIKNILKFLRQNHFDGIDLDWEYPAHREGGKSRDRDNYAQFVQELRAEFERESEKTGRPRLLLTMAVPAGIEYIEKGYDIPKLNKYLDWFNLLTYDFHSSHEPSVNHHAPLYSLEEESEYNYDAELNIDYSIKFYLNAGADRDKLVLGIPTYGRSYTLINEESTEIGAPAEAPGEQGDATREKGYLAYYEICQNIKEDPEWTVVQPNPNAMGPYAYRRNQWVGYDDEAIVRKKAQYVVENGLGGIMFWAIDNDDFRGICTGKQYPLIEAAKEAMLDALGFGINEVSKPSAPQKPLRSRSRENSASTRNRITTTEHKLTYAERKGSTKRVQIAQQSSTRSKQQTSTTEAPIKLTESEGSSLYIGGRTTTPPPPTTPDPGTDFKCEEEGFFQHPRDCKKYYWCLDSGPSGLGIVAHQFTCPSGLYFNPAADSCDFARNVPCKTKKSTTAAPITTPATTTTTTPRPNRLTAATSRPTTFFRTTPRTTTTTTTEASEEEDIEYEEEENSSPSPYAKRKGSDKDAEEDPQVIKELIELIRKVGGIEELEKHLLRKEDGTISIKENSSSSSSSSLTATTPSTISKTLYEKVLSKPNALNSFRNRFTSTSSVRTIKTQTKTQDNAAAEVEIEESHETDNKSSGATTGFSKYSSVLRGNSRQGPQNEGLSKLSEFDGFLKEKKQYITINRNRGTKKTSDVEEDEEEIEEEVSKTKSDNLTQEEEEEYDVKTTRKAFSSVTPSYSTIRRTRPSTTTEVNNDEAEDAEEKEVTERKSYSTLNRSRSRATTTTETPDVVEVTAGSTRYKYLERTRPTRPTTESSSKIAEEEDTDVEDDDEAKTKENTVHFKAVNIENTRETQQQQQEITTNTQRTYASIGRRTTTSTPDTETTTAGAAKTSTTTTTTAAPTTTTTPSTTETPITTPLTIIETTTPDSILLTTNIPITTTTNPTTISTTTTTITTTTTKTTTLPNEGEDVLGTSNTTPVPNEINSVISETLDSSLHLNSLLTESSTSTSTTPIPIPTTESGLDTNEQEIDSHSTTTEATISSTTATVLNGNGNDKLTKTAGAEDQEEVNLVSKQRNKTLYNTRTRTTTTTTTTKTLPTTTNSDIETTTSPTNAKKTLGVRRQQQKQQVLLNRSSQTKTITTDTPNPTTESVNNDFLGTVSSPRPFGFPKRRTRPSINAAGTTTTSAIPNNTDEEVVKSTEESLITKQKASTKLNAAANSQTKVSSHNTILSETTTTTTTTTTANVHDAQTSSQQELLLTQQDESEVTGTEHLNSKDTKVESLNQHVVVAINGSEGINDSLRHVNNVVLNLNSNNSNSNSNSNSNNSAQTIIKTHTLVQEVEHHDDNDDNKKLIVTEVTTEERVRQNVSPDHVTSGNVLETNDKIERLSNKNEKQDELFKETGKYRGKSLETEENYDYNQVDDGEDEGRGFKTYTTINRRRQQTQSATGIETDGNVVNNFRVTEVVKSGTEHAHDNENKNVGSSVNNKFKYSTITRGQSSKTETVKGSVHESETSGLNIKSKYSSIARGQTSKSETEQGDEHDNQSSGLNIKTKYSSTTRGQTSKPETDQENEHESESSGLNVKSKYSSINRGQISKTETVQENNHENENATRNIKYSKYASVNRGQTLYKGTEENESENSSLNSSLLNRGQTVYKETDQNENENSSLNNKFEYSSVTRGQSSKTATEQENEHETESSGLNIKSKYSWVNRGQTLYKGNEENQSENSSSSANRGQTLYKGTEGNESENSSLNNKFEYSSVIRGQSSKTVTEQENEHESESSGLNVKSKYSSITRGQTSKSEAEHGNEHDNESSSLNNKFKYSSVTRGQSSKTATEQENKHESESSGLNLESKYSSVNRGQTLYKGKEENQSENSSSSVNRGQTLYKGTEQNESENSSLNNKFEHSSVTRGQSSKTATEEENEHESESSGLNLESKYSSVNRGQTLYKGTEQNESANSSLNNKFEHSSVTRGQSSKTATEQENEHESENSGLKYSSVNRGQTLYKGTEQNESENLGLNIKSKYSSITRGHTSKSETEQGNEHDNESSSLNNKFKYSSVTRGQTSKTVTEQGNEHENESSGLNIKTKYSSNTDQSKFQYTTASQKQNSGIVSDENNTANIHSNTTESNGEKKSYTTITRNRGTSTSTENIPYKAIVRDNGGVQLTEDQLSGFIKNAGEEISRKTYQAISRGGQVLQSENTEINEKDHYHINALNTLGRTEIESNRENANKEDATIEKSVAIEDNATTKKLSSTTTTTTTEEYTTEQPTTASVLDNTSSPEEAIETTTVPTTTTTTPEPTTRKSFFKSRVTTATSNADSETGVEESARKGTFNANTQVKQEEETTTLTGRRRTVYKRPTESNSQNTNEAKEKTETQTNFRRRTILRKNPTVTVQTETEVDETKQKFDRGSLISLESETSQDGIETSTLTNLPRATYRPKEKGDLSSLLALDLAKKSGNKATLTFGNGKRRRPGQSGLQVSETEDDSETTVRIAGSASDELVSNGESVTTATRKRIFGSQGVKSNTEIKGETASQVSGNRSKITFGSAGKISTETDNANNFAANGQQSTTQSVNGRRRVIVRKRIQSGQALRSQNANNVESTVVSNSNINNSESLVNQNGKAQIGLSNVRFSSSTSKSNSNSESESVGTEPQDSKAVIEGEIKNESTSEVKLKDAKVTGTEKKFSYNSVNRKNVYANRRVVASQTAEDSENTESVVRTSNRATLNKERNSANSARSQSQDSSRKSAYVNRRGSLNKNNHETTEEVEILEDGSKRIKTTFYETVNTGGQVKTIKRTKIKTIIKQEPEYIDETEDITPTTTTRRPLRSRGSAKFHTDDLSSLLALDFASKSNRHEQNDKSLTKHRRKLIRKPVIIKEEEHVEEIIEDLPTRPTRLPATTAASQIISNRIRPSRPTTTEANLTESDSGIKVEEKSVLSTTKRKFGLRRPTNVASKATIQSTIVNETVDKDDTISTTRSKFAFKRPINTVKTVKTTEQETNVTAQTSTESAANVNSTEGKDFTLTRRKFAFKRPHGSAQIITNTEQVTKTIITETEQTNGNAVGGNKFINRFKSKSVTINKDEETTTGPLPITSIVTEPTTLETTNSVSSTEHTTENLLQNQDALDAPKTHSASESQGKSDEISNGLANVVNTLKTATEVETETKTNILKGKGFTKDATLDLARTVSELETQAEKVTETEVADAIEMKNEIISGKAFGQDLSLPIYHRRKYYQYYKDSPITYISPATARSETQQTNVNVEQQIHDVFNVSNEHLQENQNNDEVLAVKAVKQAQQINSELSHFLLKTPGSK